MRVVHRLAPLAAVVLLASACGGSSSSNGGGGPGTASAFLESALSQEEGKIIACENQPAWAAPYDAPSDPSNIVSAVNSGRIQYDSTQAQACLNALSAASCQQFADNTWDQSTCNVTLVGKVGSGGSCYSWRECMSGYYCTYRDTNSCPGTCAAQLSNQASCASYGECISGPATTPTTASHWFQPAR